MLWNIKIYSTYWTQMLHLFRFASERRENAQEQLNTILLLKINDNSAFLSAYLTFWSASELPFKCLYERWNNFLHLVPLRGLISLEQPLPSEWNHRTRSGTGRLCVEPHPLRRIYSFLFVRKYGKHCNGPKTISEIFLSNIRTATASNLHSFH